jgi:hypothetical protein
VLATMLEDTAKAWRLQPDGSYQRLTGGEPTCRSQHRFVGLAREKAHGAENPETQPASYRARTVTARLGEK